jgi:7-cyano-7-deazaguanine synthase
VVLLSGGLDSTTCLSWALREGFRPVALSLDYGQRQRVELARARVIATRLGVEHRVLAVDLAALGGSALTTDELAVPKDRELEAEPEAGEIPITYVPARNTVLLSLALGLAEVSGARHIVIGANAIDYSGYPDCRPEFLQAFAALANLATRAGVEGARFEVLAPLLELSKGGIVQLAREVNAPLELTWSCYDPQGEDAQTQVACGRCDACQLRLRGFAAAGDADPVPYTSGETP